MRDHTNESRLAPQGRGGRSNGRTLSSPPLSGAAIPAARKPGAHALAFVGVYVFTLLLYLRPNELLPGIFGALPIVKTVAGLAALAYVGSKLSSGEPLTIWPLELKMVMLIATLGVLLIPVAQAPGESIEMLSDTFLKVVLIFTMMVNLLDTRERINSLIHLTLLGGVWIAFGAIKSYRAGDFAKEVGGLARIEGYGGGMFGNPNDLATALVMLLPLAVALALNRKGGIRYFYFGCAALFGVGVMITFSRGGFLGLLAVACVMAWKIGRRQRFQTFAAGLIILVVFAMIMPGGYGKRIFTIFHPDEDSTGSAQIRREVLKLGAIVALAHPLGVGVANFHMYSRAELRAHNAYIEISAELGIAGLLAYLTLLFAPLRTLRRLEKATSDATDERGREKYHLSVALQATIAAYMICSFFASIQYYWFLYYPVAFAIGLRAIHQREPALEADSPELPVPQPARSTPASGVLWQTRSQRTPGRNKALRPRPYELVKGGEK